MRSWAISVTGLPSKNAFKYCETCEDGSPPEVTVTHQKKGYFLGIGIYMRQD